MEFIKKYEKVKAIKYDSSKESIDKIGEMCGEVAFLVRPDDGTALLEVLDDKTRYRIYIQVPVNHYVVAEPDGYCYIMPDFTFEKIYNELFILEG